MTAIHTEEGICVSSDHRKLECGQEEDVQLWKLFQNVCEVTMEFKLYIHGIAKTSCLKNPKHPTSNAEIKGGVSGKRGRYHCSEAEREQTGT